MTLKTLPIPVFLPVVLASCIFGFGSTVLGSGTTRTEKRDVASFEKIEVRGSEDVEVMLGDRISVEVEAENNVVPLVITEVEGQVLKIFMRESHSTGLGVHVRVLVPKLSGVALSGSGSVRVAGLEGGDLSAELRGSGKLDLEGKLDHLTADSTGSGDLRVVGLEGGAAVIHLRGSGDLELRGALDTLDVTVAGSGDVHAKALVARVAAVEIKGSGDAEVQASERLRAEVLGSGSIGYAGKPGHLEQKVRGSGRVAQDPAEKLTSP